MRESFSKYRGRKGFALILTLLALAFRIPVPGLAIDAGAPGMFRGWGWPQYSNANRGGEYASAVV